MYTADGTFTDEGLLTFTTRLRAPFGVLAEVLGPPSSDRPEKCSTFWALHTLAHGGEHVWLMDWQDGDPTFKVNVFRALPFYDWRVWTTDEEAATRFCRWLSAEVIRAVCAVKTLSAEGKVKLNELLRAGVPLAEAKRRVPLGVNREDAERRFAWPIEA